MVGLLLIALGTGGIKPCVAAFGGDQFEDHQACGPLYTHTRHESADTYIQNSVQQYIIKADCP